MKRHGNAFICALSVLFLSGCTQLGTSDRMILEETKKQAVQAAMDADNARESAERSAQAAERAEENAAISANAANAASEKSNRIFQQSTIK